MKKSQIFFSFNLFRPNNDNQSEYYRIIKKSKGHILMLLVVCHNRNPQLSNKDRDTCSLLQ